MLTLRFGLPVGEKEDLPIHVHSLAFCRKEPPGLHPQQGETEDHQDITGELPHNGENKMNLRAEKEIVCKKHSGAVDEEPQGNHLQEESGPNGVLGQRGKILIRGLLKGFPAVRNRFEKLLVGLVIFPEHLQPDLFFSPEEEITFQQFFPFGEKAMVLSEPSIKGKAEGDQEDEGNAFIQAIDPHLSIHHGNPFSELEIPFPYSAHPGLPAPGCQRP